MRDVSNFAAKVLCSKQVHVERTSTVTEVSADVEWIDRSAAEDKARLSRCETATRRVMQAFESMLRSN
jgi:hypothetical protein